MNEKKKQTYNSSVMALPALKLVIGDIPHPDGDAQRPQQQVRPFGADLPGAEAKNTLNKLIGHIQENK